MEIRYKEPLKKHTSFRIGGTVQEMVFPRNEKDIAEIIGCIRDKPYFVISNGTNILFNDVHFNGVIINMSMFERLKYPGKSRLLVSSGTMNSDIIAEAREKGLINLTFLAGIPGRFGGAAYMNAGAYGHCISEYISSIMLFDLRSSNFIILDRDSMNYFYRGQDFIKPYHIILSGIIKLEYGDKAETGKQIELCLAKRKQKHPLEKPSAGSVFKNPKGCVSGILIEELGLKGTVCGGAQISQKHGNFIVNNDNASFDDVIRLVDMARKMVLKEYNIELETEIRIIKSDMDFYRL